MSLKHRILAAILSASLLSFLAFAAPVMAQDDFEEPIAEEAAAPDGDGVNVIDLYQQGGWAMHILLFLSMSGVALIIFNGLTIRSKAFLVPDTVEELEPLMKNLEIEKAQAVCEERPAPVTNIIGAGLNRIRGGEIDAPAMEKAIDESTAEELASPYIFINYLSVIGAIAPMVGLLGTVSGMIKAFRAISDQGLGSPDVLAANISEALITTASGLVVAIPALIAFYIFKNKYGKITAGVGRVVNDLFYDMIHSARRGG
ncbi:MAG: MotA/TolQ/ExbB proton channel family protein [Verrucomicrobiota bacterium]